MPFQSAPVQRFQGAGIPGELYANSPLKAESFIVNSLSAANNVFGRAMSLTAQGVVSAGQPAGSIYQGILANPKQNVSFGTTGGGPLAPTLTLNNYAQADVVQMGTLWVTLPDTANIGDVVIFDTTTGELATQAPGTALPSGFANANAYVDYFDVADAGLAVITLSPTAPVLSSVPEIVIAEGTVTWTGSGTTKTATITGALTTDIVIASIQVAPTEAAYLVSAKITSANPLTLTLSAANTSNNAVISYRVVRP